LVNSNQPFLTRYIQNVTAYLLTRDDIESVVVDASRLGKASGFIERTSKQSEKMSMNDLKKHHIIGEGGFGVVWLCTSKKDNTAYALKIINKRKVLKEKQERSLMREKELLSMLQHPFILGIENSFADDTNCYLVLPVIQGGTLYSYLSKMTKGGRLLPKSHVAFYAATVIEGLGHFHHRFIAYRDLKLENVSFCEQFRLLY
jgi:serine/threonine protein kinase